MKRILSLCLIGMSGLTSAQQLPVTSQYLINKFALSPAYAGHNESFEAFLLYRNSSVGIPNSPRLKDVNVNGAITKNMGIGASLSNEQAGIFNSFTGALSYSYQVNLTHSQALRFGLSGGFFENHIDLSGSRQKDLNDPVALSNQQQAMVFDAGAGVMYRYKGLNAGIAIPRLIESRLESSSGNSLYTLKRHYTGHLSYNYPINRAWRAEPFLIVRKTAASPLLIEAAAMVNYMGQFWLAGSYKNNAVYAASAGLVYRRLAVSYTFEFSSSGIAGASSGTHELNLGILIGKNKNAPSSVFNQDARQAPYYNFIEK
jgi:type IX secretion system PorP/SprF family membrane protein